MSGVKLCVKDLCLSTEHQTIAFHWDFSITVWITSSYLIRIWRWRMRHFVQLSVTSDIDSLSIFRVPKRWFVGCQPEVILNSVAVKASSYSSMLNYVLLLDAATDALRFGNFADVKRRIRLIGMLNLKNTVSHFPPLFCRLCGQSDEWAAVIRYESRQEEAKFRCQIK